MSPALCWPLYFDIIPIPHYNTYRKIYYLHLQQMSLREDKQSARGHTASKEQS